MFLGLGLTLGWTAWCQKRLHLQLESIRAEWTAFLTAAQRRGASVKEVLEYADSKGVDVPTSLDGDAQSEYKQLAFRDPRIVRFAPWSSSDTVVTVRVDKNGLVRSFVVEQRPSSL